MYNNKVVIITRDKSDMLDAMKSWLPNVLVIKPEQVIKTDFTSFDAIAILGGTSEQPLFLSPAARIIIEQQIVAGKKVFAEYVASIGHVYFEQPEVTRFKRLVYCNPNVEVKGIALGEIMDDQCGLRIKPHDITCVHTTPILQFTMVHAHDRIDNCEQITQKINERALWFDDPANLLICSFRLSHFIQARFAPKQRFIHIIEFILNWLFEPTEEAKLDHISFVYNMIDYDEQADFNEQITEAVQRAVGWLSQPALLIKEGKEGLLEGYGTDIFGDGSQKLNSVRRADCIGEASLSFFLNSKLSGIDKQAHISDHLEDYIFDFYINRENNALNGMFRWTDEAWGVCYQDDVARAILPSMLKALYTGNHKRKDDIEAILHFLIKTTGTDGTRVFRTDNKDLTEEKLHKLHTEPGNFPSAHYNGYYYAILCLAHRLWGNRLYLEVAERGMNTLLATYPFTTREQSETEELCRLILPLAWIYGETSDEKYKTWLYRVTEDLCKYEHELGCYLEWDTDYKAVMRHDVGEGECSLLAVNGDPIVDLLYSNNWLPIAFIQAYFVTEDHFFLGKWQQIAKFMVSSQLHSEDKVLHGGWARAFDVDKKEVFASPADFGWGPWAIESGWTVAEITSGLVMGLLKDEIKHFHRL